MSEIQAPFLSEHESAGEAGGTKPGYNPSEEEKKTIRMVDNLYSKAKKYRRRYDTRWIDWYKMFRGKQWKEVRPSYRSSEVINVIFQTIQSQVPILTDSKPKLEFLPTVPSQFELSDILNKVAENDWEHHNWLSILSEVILDSHLYGTGFGYVGFDPKDEMGLGSVLFESQDPFYTFPDPEARDINGRRTKYFSTAEPVDISELKKEYPKKAEFITSDVIDFAQGDKTDIDQVMFKSPIDSKLMVEGPSGFDSIAKTQCLKITLYLKDDQVQEEEVGELNEDGTPSIGDDGNPKMKFLQKLKYPRGRKIVIGGGVLLEDGEFQFDDGLYPYVKLINYDLPREFWGMGEVEQLDGPQKTLNKVISYTLDVMSLMGNPIYIVDDTANIDTDNLFNKPGLVIEKAQGSEVRRETGVELPSFILPFVSMIKNFMDGISGQTDISRGAEPRDVTAASAIEALQEAQQTRLRLKARNIDAFLQDFGKLYISRVFQFYSLPRIVRVSGNNNAQQYFHFHVELLDQDPNSHIPFTDESGMPMKKRFAHISYPDGKNKRVEIIGDFDVRVSTGTSLPVAKSQRGNMALNLFKLQVIDDEELLKDLNYPNYESVLQRVNMKKQQAMQQQMAMKKADTVLQIEGKQAIKATPTVGMVPPPLGPGPALTPNAQ